MVEFSVSFLIILVLAITYLLYKIRDYYLFKKLQEHVSWCVVDDSSLTRCNISLFEWFITPQFFGHSSKFSHISFYPNISNITPIPKECWIDRKTEKDLAERILEEYKNWLIQNFFAGRLGISCYTKKLTSNEYFLHTIYEFLEFKKFDNPLDKTSDQFSKYEIVYLKMYYIALSYDMVVDGKPIVAGTVGYNKLNSVKEIIVMQSNHYEY